MKFQFLPKEAGELSAEQSRADVVGIGQLAVLAWVKGPVVKVRRNAIWLDIP